MADSTNPSSPAVNSGDDWKKPKQLSVETYVQKDRFNEKYDSKTQKSSDPTWFVETANMDDYSLEAYSLALFDYQLWIVDHSSSTSNKPEAVFRFPIPPQTLNVSTPFSIVTTPTLNGIVEEHNAAVFREIEIAGTMGVLPSTKFVHNRDFSGVGGSVLAATGAQDVLQSFAASNFYSQYKTRNNSFLNFKDDRLPKDGGMKDLEVYSNSGYANIHKLRHFLEYYAEKKKTGNKGLRLVFANFKDQQFYYLSPVNFNVRRSASSPLEYEYSMSFRSWGRFDPSVSTVAILEADKVATSPLAYAAAALQAAKALRNVIKYAGAWLVGQVDAMYSDIGSAFSGWTGNGGAFDTLTKTSLQNRGFDFNFGGSASNDKLNAQRDARAKSIAAENKNAIDKLIDPALQNGQSASALTQDASQSFSNAGNRATNIGIGIADAIGLGSESYDSINQRTGVEARTDDPNFEQLESMYSANATRQSMDAMVAALMRQKPNYVSPMEYVAGLADKSGIAFNVPVSKFSVSLPYGATLESVSNVYLGTPNRWIEIATLNGLMEPYIDNVGFDAPIVVDPVEYTMVIQTSQDSVGNYIIVYSDTVPRSTFQVVKRRRISDDWLELTIKPPTPNGGIQYSLTDYKTANRSYVHWYTPNTAHAGQQIYIPSNLPFDSVFNTSQIEGINQYDDLVRVSGVDLLLKTNRGLGGSTTFDLALDTETGDVPLAAGMTNIYQSLTLALSTKQGSVIQHPEYGIAVQVGDSIADIDLVSVRNSIEKNLANDPSVGTVEFVSVAFNAPVLSVAAGVRVAGVNKVLPLNFDINLRSV
jgi:hypothetical protein